MEELKPCPFCGSEEVRIYDDPCGSVYVKCAKCFSRSSKFSIYCDEEAIKAWNRRAKE